MLIIVAVFLVVMIWLTPKIVRALRWLTARLRGLFGGDPEESANQRCLACRSLSLPVSQSPGLPVSLSFFHLSLKFARSSFAPERLLATRAITKRRSERRLR